MPESFYPGWWVAVRKDLEGGQGVGHGEQDRARPCIIVRPAGRVGEGQAERNRDRGRCALRKGLRPVSPPQPRRAHYAEHVTVTHDVIAHIPSQFV